MTLSPHAGDSVPDIFERQVAKPPLMFGIARFLQLPSAPLLSLSLKPGFKMRGAEKLVFVRDETALL